MLEIAILDDNYAAQMNLREMIQAHFNADKLVCHISLFSHPNDLRADLSKNARFDILMLDINLGDAITGIDIAREINELNPRTKIIYITAYNDYSADISDSEFVYYLLKPINPVKLSAALEKAVAKLRADKKSILSLNLNNRTICVPANRLCYAESNKHDVIYSFTGGQSVTARARLDDLEDSLSFYSCFLRVHQSYLVNMAHIRSLDMTELTLDNGRVIPISRSRRMTVRDTFMDYALTQLK